jgi:hypothetical protein
MWDVDRRPPESARELAGRWLDIGVKGEFRTTDPFMRFMCSWVAFNALYVARVL